MPELDKAGFEVFADCDFDGPDMDAVELFLVFVGDPELVGLLDICVYIMLWAAVHFTSPAPTVGYSPLSPNGQFGSWLAWILQAFAVVVAVPVTLHSVTTLVEVEQLADLTPLLASDAQETKVFVTTLAVQDDAVDVVFVEDLDFADDECFSEDGVAFEFDGRGD